MKSISTFVKTTILTGVIAILTSIPVLASTTTQATVINSTPTTITVQADNNIYSFDNEDSIEDRWQVGDNMTITTDNDKVIQAKPIVQDKQKADHYTTQNNEVVTNYSDGSYYINSDVKIQSISYIDNTITIAKNSGELYSFYVDDPESYYLAEIINITMVQNSQIIDCIVDSEPIIYNTTIDLIQGDTAYLIANGNKYSFINEEGSDGWITGDICKIVIQDNRLLEVRPMHLI